MTRVLLIRHGESVANRSDTFSGYSDVALEEKGLIQAARTAKFVTEKYHIDKVYASDLQRAFTTGKAVAELLGLEVIPEQGMREINGGDWEGVPFTELPIRFAQDYHTWMTDIGRVRCTGGESTEELGKRVSQALTKIAQENEGKTVVVATHATPIRVMQTLIETGDITKMQSIPWVSNASVTELEYSEGTWQCIAVGQDNHLKEFRTKLPENV